MQEDKINNALEKAENIAKQNVGENSCQKSEEERRIKAQNEQALLSLDITDSKIEAEVKREGKTRRAVKIRERARRKTELFAIKERLSAEKKEQNERSILYRKPNGKLKGAVVGLSLSTLVLAVALTVTFLIPSRADNMLEAGYAKSFYQTVASVDNIDLNLSKILASRDSGAMQRYLVDTAINSELAENDIQQLPLHDENKFYTTKLINQIGDFAKYLNDKLANGQTLLESDYEGLRGLYNANLALKNSLKKTASDMGGDFSFTSIMEGGRGNALISNFDQLQNLSQNFPQLIYDGPFSDGQNNCQMKGLKGEVIDENRAIEIFRNIFSPMGVSEVECQGTCSNSVQCYNIQGTLKGEKLFAEISRRGGKMIMFSYSGSCKEVVISEQGAIATAKGFLDKLEILDMQPVWINLANNVYTINFASEVNGVIAYPDLIKIRVCAETNSVIGIEAKSYYTNHTERDIPTPKISEEEARKKLNSDMEIDKIRLAIVPIGVNNEKLCYEFSGLFDGATYYVYIDAVEGRQVEMFKVVDGTEGKLLQ